MVHRNVEVIPGKGVDQSSDELAVAAKVSFVRPGKKRQADTVESKQN